MTIIVEMMLKFGSSSALFGGDIIAKIGNNFIPHYMEKLGAFFLLEA